MDSVVDDLPLLGEPFAVELANSHYVTSREDHDFLADPAAVRTWFRLAPAALGIVVPPHPSPDTVAAIRRVRDATRLFLTPSAEERSPSPRVQAAEVLHREARRAAGHLALDLDDGAPRWHLHHEGGEQDVFVSATASRCILFLGGDDADRVRPCARPDCPMLFVQRHRARRFCGEPCAHSLRQSRYYRSRRRDLNPPSA